MLSLEAGAHIWIPVHFPEEHSGEGSESVSQIRVSGFCYVMLVCVHVKGQ